MRTNETSNFTSYSFSVFDSTSFFAFIHIFFLPIFPFVFRSGFAFFILASFIALVLTLLFPCLFFLCFLLWHCLFSACFSFCFLFCLYFFPVNLSFYFLSWLFHFLLLFCPFSYSFLIVYYFWSYFYCAHIFSCHLLQQSYLPTILLSIKKMFFLAKKN